MRGKLTLALPLLLLPLAACGGDAEVDDTEALEEPAVFDEPAGAADAEPIPATEATEGVDLPPGVTMAMVSEGRQLYGTVCVACHGPAGAGTTLGPNLTDAEWINISGEFDEIMQVIHTGVPEPVEHPAPMMPLGGGQFNDEQVRALAAYVYSLSHGA